MCAPAGLMQVGPLIAISDLGHSDLPPAAIVVSPDASDPSHSGRAAL